MTPSPHVRCLMTSEHRLYAHSHAVHQVLCLLFQNAVHKSSYRHYEGTYPIVLVECVALVVDRTDSPMMIIGNNSHNDDSAIHTYGASPATTN
jgi:hypothetical protein